MKLGFIWDEIFNNHSLGYLNVDKSMEPLVHWETPAGKRRIYSLLNTSGVINNLNVLKEIKDATENDILSVHSKKLLNKVKQKNIEGGVLGDMISMIPGSYEVALKAIGASIKAVDYTLENNVSSYVLLRPAGHHATSNESMGFCIFNNIAIAVEHALKKVSKVAIIDFDVHHGNGTQSIFYERSDVLFISIHQDNNYPSNSGLINENGINNGIGYTINIPLPPGSGNGAYKKSFNDIILPSLDKFKPDILFVSAGFDANFMDPLGRMMLSSNDYHLFGNLLSNWANKNCNSRIVSLHEGGYSESYVPYCTVNYIQGLLNKEPIKDPFINEGCLHVYQDIQENQDLVIEQVKRHINGETNNFFSGISPKTLKKFVDKTEPNYSFKDSY